MRRKTHYHPRVWLALVLLLPGPMGAAFANASVDALPPETLAGAAGRTIYVTKVLTSEHIFDSTEVKPSGYPIAEPDKLELLGLLHARAYAELERILTAYQEAYEQDYHKEFWVATAFDAFGIADPSIKPFLDEWLEVIPDSWCAHLARAEHFCEAGWQARGSDFASRTAAGQFARMGQYLEFAVKEARTALALRAHLVPAHSILISCVAAAGEIGDEKRSRRELLDAALRDCPESFRVRDVYMHFLSDQWGGSHEARQAFADEVVAQKDSNPLLATFQGLVYSGDCASELAAQHLHYLYGQGRTINFDAMTFGDLLKKPADELPPKERFDTALALINKALELADMSGFYALRSEVYRLRKENDLALIDLQVALSIVPQDKFQLSEKGLFLAELGRREEARVALAQAAALDPGDVRPLLGLGQIAYDLGDMAEAERAWRQAARAIPGEVEIKHALGVALHRQGKFDEAISQFRQVLAERPDHPYAHMWLGMALEETGKLEEAIEHYRLAVRNGFPQAFASHRLRAATAKVAPPFWWMMSQRLALLGFAVGLLVFLRRRRKARTPPATSSPESA